MSGKQQKVGRKGNKAIGKKINKFKKNLCYNKEAKQTTITKKLLHEKEKQEKKRERKLISAQNSTQDLLQAGPFRCHYATSGHTTKCVIKKKQLKPISSHLKNRCPTKLIWYKLLYKVGHKTCDFDLRS